MMLSITTKFTAHCLRQKIHKPGEPGAKRKVQHVQDPRPGQTTAAAQSGLCFPCNPDVMSAFCGLLSEAQALQMF